MAHMKRDLDRAKQSGRSTTRQPGTADRPANRSVDTHARPFSSPEDKRPVENPRAINKAPLPSEQPTKQKARAAKKREERMEKESTPKAKNIAKAGRIVRAEPR